jgi:hypothetical protein
LLPNLDRQRRSNARTWTKPEDRDILLTAKGSVEEESEIALLGFEQIEDEGRIFHYLHETSGFVLYLGSNNQWWCEDAVDGFPARSDSTLQDFFLWFKERGGRLV